MTTLEKINKLKRFLLIGISILVIIIPYIFINQSPSFHSTKGLILYFLEVSNLIIILWLFNLISEINLYGQGEIGKSLALIFLGLILFAIQSIVICLGDLQLQYFSSLAVFLAQPIVQSILRTIILLLLNLGILGLVRLYKG